MRMRRYGGYFVLAGNLEKDAALALARIGETDSIVIDPHKHGLQTLRVRLSCCFDPGVGRLYKHDPLHLLQFRRLHLGEISWSVPGLAPQRRPCGPPQGCCR